MPIRINLRELFDSDSQSITIDKLNFNFNKLLELGVGLPGAKGITGPQGGVGPSGIPGPIGNDGNYWYVGSGDPNPQTFIDLEDEDFYLDTTNSSIWQYSSTTSTWTKIIDFAGVVNSYLNQFGVTFIRGLGESSPDDSRYILFPNRGNTLVDQTTDTLGGSSNNDILFLNNFNEKLNIVDIFNFPTSTDDLYTAIQKIYVDSTLGVPGRYHLELGSLYQDTNGGLDNYLTGLKHNLKFRHVVDDLGGVSSFPATNDYLYLGKISLSKPELNPITEIDYNSALEIIVPKYNNESSPVVRGEMTMRIGPKEAIAEYYSGLNLDGFTLDLGSLNGKVAFGIVKDLSSIRPEVDGLNWLTLDFDNNISGIYLNGRTVQTGGSIEQLSTGEVTLESSKSVSNGFLETHWLNQGMAISGTKMIAVSGTRSVVDLDDEGKIHLFDISNPKSPILDYTVSSDSYIQIPAKVGPPVDTQYILGPGISDVQIAGEYVYFVNNQDDDTSGGLAPSPGFTKSFSRFQIGKIYNDRENDQITRVSYLDETVAELEGAYRLEVRGKWAWVICNSEQSTYSNNVGRLTTVDVSDPLNPSIGDTYLDGGGTKYVAMDVNDSLVAVLRSSASASGPPGGYFLVDLLVFDASTPTSISSPLLSTTASPLFTGNYADRLLNPNSFGGVRIYGKYAYVVWHNELFIYDIQVGGATSPSLVSQFSLGLDSSSGNNTYGIDLEIIGTTVYALGYDDQTDSTNPGCIIKIDVSDVSNPYIISTSRLSSIAKPSRIKYSGKYLYVTSATDSSTSTNGGIEVIEIDGIRSPGAHIDSLRTGHLQVDKNAVVQENLKVNHSLNVGPGGVYIDAGQGLTVDGPGRFLGGVNLSGGFNNFSRVEVSRTSNQTVVSNLLVRYDVDFNDLEYDTLNEFDLVTNRFTATEDGYYNFEFKGQLQSLASSHIINIGNIWLEDSNLNILNISRVYQGATIDGLSDEYVKQGNRYDMSGSRTIYLSAGEWAKITVQNFAQDFSVTNIDLDLAFIELRINRIG